MRLFGQSSFRVSAALVVSLSLISTPASAQFGRLLPRDARNVIEDATDDKDNCGKEEKTSVGSRVLGGILGRSSRRAARDAGISSYVPMAKFSDQLTTAIACQLDPQEQEQAAEATLRATRSLELPGGSDEDEDDDDIVPPLPPVGSTAAWKSETRADVSGSSTIVGRDQNADARIECITVTDVIIVRGEETTANKRMCRPPGSRRYSLVA